MMSDISIIVPSHNGSDTLKSCLDALGALHLPDAVVEVFLIDNASDDATPSIFSDYAEKHGWTVLREEKRGKSFALNTGLAATNGALIAFIDDDVIPDVNWLQAFLDASRRFPDAGVFAGQIRPRWPGQVPDWLQTMSDDGRCCGCTALDRNIGPYPPIDVKGGNFMVRRSAIGDLKFDTIIGHFDGTSRAVGGEDTTFVTQIAQAGFEVIFVPDACAEHVLLPDEVGFSALFKRQMRIGRSSATYGSFGLLDKVLTFPAIGAYAAAFAVLVLVGQRGHAMKQMFKIATRSGRIEQWFLKRR